MFLTKRKKVSETTKKFVFARDECCVKCGSFDRLEIDHIVACDLGGANIDAKNLQLLCHSCHLEKTLKDKAEMRELKLETKKKIHLQFHPHCLDYPIHHPSCSHLIGGYI